jgi:putative ABC transport system permease protein
MWDALRLDVRHSFRSLRRAPTFSLIVVVTLALAVGATTAVGSLLNALAWRTLAVPHPEQLVAVSALEPRANVSGYFYADTFKAYRSAQRSFAQMSMYSGGGLLRVETRSGVFEEASTEAVSPEYFDIVGARSSAGRVFSESDGAVVVISEGFRRRIFGNAAGIGEAIKVNAVPATVIGVAADGSDGLDLDRTADIIVPVALMRAAVDDVSRPLRSRTLVGRLAPGVSIDAARAELLARWPSIQSATLPAALSEPDRQALLRQRVEVAPLALGFSGLRDRYRTTLGVLLGLAGILLAVACANLAGLSLARSLTRRHQVAIRLALGGSARRVFWQLLLDGILLSTAALAGAVPLAWAIIRAITASLMFATAKFPSVTPDARVLASTVLLTVSIGLAIGVVSAWRAVTARVDEALRPGWRMAGSLGRFGRGLLVAQVALSMSLLVGAGLFTATLARLRANDTSLQSQRIVFSRAYQEPGDRQLLPPEYYQTLVADLGHMPGADAAALSVYYPTYYRLMGPLPPNHYDHYTRADDVATPAVAVLPEFVSPGFFDLFRLPRLQGRDVSWDDGPGKPAVALVSASLARALFPAGDAIGHQIRLVGPQPRDIEVIGVVGDAAYGKLDDPRPFVVFRPILQDMARSQFSIAYVRASGDLATVRDGYTRVVKALGHRALRGFITSSEWVDQALLQQRFTAGLATFAAGMTVLLACIGVYGLLAYSVAARVREIGVRLALGAARGTVVWMIVRDGLAIAVPGVLIGALCAWAAARLVRAQLYGIAPSDPRTLLIAAAISLATVLAASLFPALRASRVAPVEALREE